MRRIVQFLKFFLFYLLYYSDLTCVSDGCGLDDAGLGILLKSNQVKRVICSYFGANKHFQKLYFAGEIEVELTPQGTLAEKLRAAG